MLSVPCLYYYFSVVVEIRFSPLVYIVYYFLYIVMISLRQQQFYSIVSSAVSHSLAFVLVLSAWVVHMSETSNRMLV